MNAHAAAAAIIAGSRPTIDQSESYELKQLMIEAGYFSDENLRKAWVCVRPYSYFVVNVGINEQTDLVEWSVGQVVPRLAFVCAEAA